MGDRMARPPVKLSWRVVTGILVIVTVAGILCFWVLYYRDVMLQTINQRIPALAAIRDTPRLPDPEALFPRTAPRVRETLRSAFSDGRPQL